MLIVCLLGTSLARENVDKAVQKELAGYHSHERHTRDGFEVPLTENTAMLAALKVKRAAEPQHGHHRPPHHPPPHRPHHPPPHHRPHHG